MTQNKNTETVVRKVTANLVTIRHTNELGFDHLALDAEDATALLHQLAEVLGRKVAPIGAELPKPTEAEILAALA